jgi:hypothetical protein
MRSIDIDLAVHKAIEDGRQSFEESENSILRRLLKIDRPATSPSEAPKATRSSGAYSTRIAGKPIEANTLRELLRRVILFLEAHRSGFVAMLAQHRTRRGRCVVARTAADIYPGAPHLAEFAARLDENWWYDTNVGLNQVAAYFRLFTELAELPEIPTISKRSEKTALTLEDLDL